ncbi:hypothetical protein [Nitrosomonas sp. Nm166]|uniref:hypothetical protein n=1 Tax=Nitrosomonas sp. Nm166 TaxID=1881054 RepID=UPI0008ED31FE|nr:hypothetical protein [Nitrosomonas sp. Nm166]SFD94696.1 hypothetical protein SAMN05428977_100338 [Nitrosomonas sp. Nm166]
MSKYNGLVKSAERNLADRLASAEFWQVSYCQCPDTNAFITNNDMNFMIFSPETPEKSGKTLQFKHLSFRTQ